MDKVNDLKTTGQGISDAPEPVGTGSGRAGSPRPSASDCTDPAVEAQAADRGKATGTPIKETPIRKRSEKGLVLQVSPPEKWPSDVKQNTSDTPRANTLCLDLTWDEETSKSVKRKRIESPISSPATKENNEGLTKISRLQSKVAELIKEAYKEMRLLHQVVSTKSRCKEAAIGTEKVKSIISQLMTAEIQNLLINTPMEKKGTTRNERADIGHEEDKKNGGKEVEKSLEDRIRQLEEEKQQIQEELKEAKTRIMSLEKQNGSSITKCTIGTQTLTSDEEIKDEIEKTEIQLELPDKSYAHFREINLTCKWYKENFKSTRIIDGDFDKNLTKGAKWSCFTKTTKVKSVWRNSPGNVRNWRIYLMKKKCNSTP